MYGRGRPMWQQAPQRETRTVSRETEVSIPNREALSIFAFLGICLTGILWWGRFWRSDVLAFLVALLVAILWWFKGPDVAAYLAKPPKTGSWWKDYISIVVFVLLVQFIPPVCVIGFWYAIVLHVLDYWYEEMPFWSDLLLGGSVGFAVATVALVWFHFNNIWNPNWPPPQWYEDRDAPGPSVVNREPVYMQTGPAQGRQLSAPAAERDPPVVHKTCGVDDRDLREFVRLLPVRGLGQRGWTSGGGTQLATRKITQSSHWREFIVPLARFQVIEEPQGRGAPFRLKPDYFKAGLPDPELILGQMGLLS